ncbi:MAG: HlyD family efflux transporter periplasmic adaptor subunit [Methylomarinum sp.]|nr:HlyD family efflux transporter periplasmic adaptor subunit [Methylomarinum sp.]
MAGDVTELPPLRQELDLVAGPSNFDGSPTWSLYDPANQRYYRIGQIECEILMAWTQGTAAAVVEKIQQLDQLSVTEEDVTELYQFLFSHNLLQMQGAEATQHLLKQANAAKQHWFSWLVHHYLFFKLPLLRPDRLLKQTYPYIRCLYQPVILYLLMAVLVINLYVLIDRWELFSQTFLHFFSLEGMVFYGFALSLAKILHELGHAYTAHRYGCRVATMGVAFLVMFPVLYTDTSDAWKLTSRRQRLGIAIAGIAVELALAIICTSLWHFLPDGALRSAVFLMASTTWIMTLLINLNPFMRFDGYYLLSDFLGVENLQQRAFNLAKWQLRRALFAMQETLPEQLPTRLHRILVAYAWGTWVYRFLLFLGIALLVYHFFFKALGVILMMIEIIWFIALPVIKEIKHWLANREAISWNKNSLLTAIASVLLLLICFIPWQSRVEAPAVLKAAKYMDMYMPLPGQLRQVLVSRGDHVSAGQTLIQFDSSDLDSRISQSQIQVELLRWQLSFYGQDKRLINRRRIVLSELDSALSEYKSLLNEREKLLFKAPFEGVILDINDQLNVGEWIAQDEAILTLAQDNAYKIEALVNEVHLGQVLSSQQAIFYPEQLDWPSIKCKIIRIDNASSNQIAPEYASIYSGSVPVKGYKGDDLVPETSVYRVWLQADTQDVMINRAVRGNVMIDAPAESYAGFLWKRVMAVLIRESGF